MYRVLVDVKEGILRGKRTPPSVKRQEDSSVPQNFVVFETNHQNLGKTEDGLYVHVLKGKNDLRKRVYDEVLQTTVTEKEKVILGNTLTLDQNDQSSLVVLIGRLVGVEVSIVTEVVLREKLLKVSCTFEKIEVT